jgi:hypothetical protein
LPAEWLSKSNILLLLRLQEEASDGDLYYAWHFY